MNPFGRPAEPIVEAWSMRFGLTPKQMTRLRPPAFCWQLFLCRSDEARRILLFGVRA